MAIGTPIRLVQENGNLIELDAQTMVLTTSRKVGGVALPATGSTRYGLDLNMNKAMINVQGIIADDQIGITPRGATAEINFGLKDVSGIEKWATNRNFDDMMSSGSDGHARLYLQDSAGDLEYIVMERAGSEGDTAYSASGLTKTSRNYGILLRAGDTTPDNGGAWVDGQKMAIAVRDYIDAKLSAKFTCEIIDDMYYDRGDLALGKPVTVKITQTIPIDYTEESDTDDYPAIQEDGGAGDDPRIISFRGSRTKALKSAGDKVQDLYGILNNSVTKWGRTAGNLVGVVGGAGAFVGGLALSTTGVGLPAGAAVATAGGATFIAGVSGLSTQVQGKDVNDYIVGIQIPFNSMLKAADGEMYTARNFFMSTGRKEGLQKGSHNTKRAGVEFNNSRGWRGSSTLTGIKGAVQKMDITYNAGEAVYEFNMIFAPIDRLM
jgi:hypothetical protein